MLSQGGGEAQMKIYNNKPPDGQDISRVVQNTQKNVGKTDAKEQVAPAQSSQPQTDKVEISKTGREVSDLMSVINQMPEVRADKIKAIQGALESGTYTVDPSKVAEKMLKEL